MIGNLLLCNRNFDLQKIPFDLATFNIFRYTLDEEETALRVFNPNSRRLSSFEEVLDSFIAELKPDVGFHNAQEWKE